MMQYFLQICNKPTSCLIYRIVELFSVFLFFSIQTSLTVLPPRGLKQRSFALFPPDIAVYIIVEELIFKCNNYKYDFLVIMMIVSYIQTKLNGRCADTFLIAKALYSCM